MSVTNQSQAFGSHTTWPWRSLTVRDPNRSLRVEGLAPDKR
jgi:hypothetical protein